MRSYFRSFNRYRESCAASSLDARESGGLFQYGLVRIGADSDRPGAVFDLDSLGGLNHDSLPLDLDALS
jgi:hypothetical protein